MYIFVGFGWWFGGGRLCSLTTNSRGEVAATFKVKGEKTLDRYSVRSLCYDDLNCRRLPTSQYQIVIGVIREWRMV